jgi:hypothetical protein
MAQKPHIEKWVLSPHAATRMAERHISADELSDVLHQPDWLSQQGPKWILAKRLKARSDNMVAAVVLQKQETDLWIVLTVVIHFEARG